MWFVLPSRDGVPYCERDYQIQFGVQCDACQKFITGKVLEVRNVSNHVAIWRHNNSRAAFSTGIETCKASYDKLMVQHMLEFLLFSWCLCCFVNIQMNLIKVTVTFLIICFRPGTNIITPAVQDVADVIKCSKKEKKCICTVSLTMELEGSDKCRNSVFCLLTVAAFTGSTVWHPDCRDNSRNDDRNRVRPHKTNI